MKAKTLFLSVCALGMMAGMFSCAPKKKTDVTTDMVDITSSANGNAPAGNAPMMNFAEESWDFGKISQGERVSHAFKFRNTGGSPLIISEAHGSCGCTVPEYPHNPVAPGADAVINVVFNSEGKHGKQEKTVTLSTNCEISTKVLTIKSEVLVPEERGGEGK